MAQAVSLRPLTAEAQVWVRVSPCGICGGQNGTEIGFLRVIRYCPVNNHSTMALHTHVSLGR
jgi:hypothetical protein